MAHKNKKLNLFVLFKPFIARLFTYLVLLYIANNNYKLFLENQEAYKEFIELLEERTLKDVKFINSTQSCPEDWDEIEATEIGETFEGCICDGYILKDAQCKLFKHDSKLRNCTESDWLGDPATNTTANSTTNSTKPNRRRLFSKNKPQLRRILTDDDGYDDDLSDNTCHVCYTTVPEMDDPVPIHLFYPQKVCLQYMDYSTFEYLKSANSDCDPDNVCNDFFCKENNDAKHSCPITYIAAPHHSPNSNITGTSKPFDYSNNYTQYDLWDTNWEPMIYMPINNLFIARDGMCSSKVSKIELDYPLMKLNHCIPSSRFYSFDNQPMPSILIYNNLTSITKHLPAFDAYIFDEIWNIQTESAMSREAIYCIINSNGLFINNYFTVSDPKSKFNDTQTETNKEQFREEIYVFTHIVENDKFQETVQTAMLYINVGVTCMELANVLFKLLNMCGDHCKTLICIFSYEGYVAFIVDVALLCIGGIAYNALHLFSHKMHHLLGLNCLDEYTFGKVSVYKLATDVVADKNFEIFLIIMTKLALIFISLIYTCISKKCRVKFREVEAILFEKEEEENEHEGANLFGDKLASKSGSKMDLQSKKHDAHKKEKEDEDLKNKAPANINDHSYINVDKSDRSVIQNPKQSVELKDINKPQKH